MRASVLLVVMVCLADGKLTRCPVQRKITASELSKISISCPSAETNSSELKYELLFNGSRISQIYLSTQPGSAEVLFSGQFEVTALHGQFICERALINPPPHRQDCLTTEVKVEGKQITMRNDTFLIANQSCPVRTPFVPEQVMWAGCGVLLVYSLSITCAAVVKWRKMKRDMEDSHEYINTRPGQ